MFDKKYDKAFWYTAVVIISALVGALAALLIVNASL